MNTSCEDVNIARGKTITCLQSSPRAKVMARDFLVHVFWLPISSSIKGNLSLIHVTLIAANKTKNSYSTLPAAGISAATVFLVIVVAAASVVAAAVAGPSVKVFALLLLRYSCLDSSVKLT